MVLGLEAWLGFYMSRVHITEAAFIGMDSRADPSA